MRRHYNVSTRIKPNVAYSYYMFTWSRIVGSTATDANVDAYVTYTLKQVNSAFFKSEVQLADDMFKGGNLRIFGAKRRLVDTRGTHEAYTPSGHVNSFVRLTYIRPVMRLKRRRLLCRS